jgi:hypothetical protein
MALGVENGDSEIPFIHLRQIWDVGHAEKERRSNSIAATNVYRVRPCVESTTRRPEPSLLMIATVMLTAQVPRDTACWTKRAEGDAVYGLG